MKISNDIEVFLKEMLEEADGTLEIQRNDLASKFNCVPSQINYVISTRFTNECGYVVESKRGGGGYIKISRVNVSKGNYLMHTINSVGSVLSWHTALVIIQNCIDYDAITPRDAKIMLAALSDNALSCVAKSDRDVLRAKLFKNILVNLVN